MTKRSLGQWTVNEQGGLATKANECGIYSCDCWLLLVRNEFILVLNHYVLVLTLDGLR